MRALVVLLFLSLTVISLGRGITAVAAEDPMAQLQVAVDQILAILQDEALKEPGKKEERHRQVLNVVDDMFDFREMARSSLGQSWNTLTQEEQDRFVKLFTTLVEQRYIGKIDSYENQKVVYQKQLVKGDRAMIYTAIVDKGQEIPIVYRLEKNNGKWLIYDMKIENVSLIVNYRRDFDSVIRKEQFTGLIEKITKQIEKSEIAN